uniref:Uncharacterized protein n=1 Tax=Chelonoidis abingdonii TaxID=106734 RepID=A0A8C0GDU8_CHEAB
MASNSPLPDGCSPPTLFPAPVPPLPPSPYPCPASSLHPPPPSWKDSQPSPLALLAATCSKIGTPGENQSTGQQQIIIDPSQASPSSSNNGNTSPSKTKSGNSATNPGQFQVVQVQNPSGSVQYQVIPQIQTTESQQIQINPASTTTLQDLQGQIQLIPAGNNQAILTVPVQIRPGVSIPLQLQTIPGTQAQVVTTLPINIGGVTLALPVINNVAAGGSLGIGAPLSLLVSICGM